MSYKVCKPMPKACDECQLNYDFCYCRAMSDEAWEKHEDDWNSHVCDREDRPDYCPLEEVKDDER